MTQLAEQTNQSNNAFEGGSDNAQQFLTFMLSGDRYGVAILCTKEIIEYNHVTKVPMMPDYIEGVINLRGSVVPVVNLANRFKTEATGITKKTSVVIVEVQDENDSLDIGIVVDMVNEVLDLEPDQISPPPSFGTTIRADFIKHMGKTDNETFMIILDVNKVLSIEELSVLQEVSAPTVN